MPLALEDNPALLSYRAREQASAWSVRRAYSQYLAGLQLGVGTGKEWIAEGAQRYSYHKALVALEQAVGRSLR